MNDIEERTKLLQRDVLLVATAALSLVSGMHFSPWFDPVAILLKPFVAGTMFGTPIVFLYLTSIFISVMTLLLTGIPAALYERFSGLKESNATSLGIWLAGTGIIGLRALFG
jgi:hypothetical protein